MRSSKRPTRLLICLASIGASMTLSACGPSISQNMIVRPYAPLLKATHLLDPTPGAARPADDTAGELAAYGDRQTGQVDKGNNEKRGALDLIIELDAENAAAGQELKKRSIFARIFHGGG